MNTTKLTALTTTLSLAGFTSLMAQFDSGSTGADGPLEITVDTTLDLPDDGVFHFTTISVAGGRTLTFNRNPLNTPVVMLAQGNVAINGIIDLDGSANNGFRPGEGGPGGFDGGFGGFSQGINNTGGDGQGPGGGRNMSGAQSAAYANIANNNLNRYGNALISPLIGGSGGAGSNGNPGSGGGGGGGAILIAANTSITVNGNIRARGRSGIGWGSGGAIRLVAPLVRGDGTLDVSSAAGASNGRIRIDTEDRYAYRGLTMNGSFSRGAQMFVFPAVNPRLDIIEVAGEAIPEGTPMPIEIELPIGSSTDRTVVIQGRDFTGMVPITVAVIPENRPSTRHDTEIDMSTGNPATVTQNVVIPEGTITRIQVWTR